MGEIAEMMLDGTLCEGCGDYLGRGSAGYPQYCRACQRRGRSTAREARLAGQQENPSRKISCKCGKRFKKVEHQHQHAVMVGHGKVAV